MSGLVMVLGLFAVTILAVVVGERTQLPYPILLLLAVAGLSFLPVLPRFAIDPEIILPLFLPPLLFAMARRASWSVFRRRWRTLLIMAFVLTAVTTVSAAGVVLLLVPGIEVPLAFALGAMVAPPDPVAVESGAEPAKVPRGIMRTLQTEGLFNDAVAIVVFSTSIRSLNFLVGAVLAVAIGYVIGWLASAASRTIRNVAATGAVTIIVPFVAYLVAEEVHASGVIAVVVTALEINRRIDPEAVRDRLMTASFWEVVDLLVTGTAFGLMGLEIRNIVDAEGWRQIAGYLGVAAAVVAVSILLRFVEIRRHSGAVPRSWRDCLVIAWCGMRGLATLALALSLPTWSESHMAEYRRLVVVVAALVLLVTLVPTGLLLPWLIRTLRLTEDGSVEAEEVSELAGRAQYAACHALEVYFENLDLPEPERHELRSWAKRLKTRLEVDHHWDHIGGTALTDTAIRRASDIHDMVVGAQSVALEAARGEILEARRDPMVDVAVVDQVLRRIDMRALSMPQAPDAAPPVPSPRRTRRSPVKKATSSGTSNLANWRGRIRRR